MPQTIHSLKTAFWNVLTQDSAGAAVRAATPRIYRKAQAATGPFIVVTFGPSPGGDVRTIYPFVWLYDDEGEMWFNLGALGALVEQAYRTDDVIPHASIQFNGYAEEKIDLAFGNRPALAMRYTVKARF